MSQKGEDGSSAPPSSSDGDSGPVSDKDFPSRFEMWRKTMCYLTGMGMTEQEKEKYLLERSLAKANRDCKRCEEYRDWNLKYSPMVRFMMDEISKVGGNLNRSNIQCLPCEEWKGGGFHPQLGILICQNRIYSRLQLEDIMSHEMVHAYDHCRFDVDWQDLRHHACSEIRASNLSGECRMMNQIVRNHIFKFNRGQQDCVRRRATLSVRANPKCKSDVDAVRAVNSVWDSCYRDTRPFEEVYR